MLVWARHWGPDQSHGWVIILQSITEEFPLKALCGIGFDLSTSRLQRSRPVKASSGVTLMTSPQGCHESVCSGPALPRSVCVKVRAFCPHAAAVFVYWKNSSVALRAKPRVRNDNHSTPQYLLPLNVLKRQIVRVGRRAVDARRRCVSTWCRVQELRSSQPNCCSFFFPWNRSTGAARLSRQTCNLATLSWRSMGKTRRTCWTLRPRTRSRTPRRSSSWWWRGRAARLKVSPHFPFRFYFIGVLSESGNVSQFCSQTCLSNLRLLLGCL